jgi:hypothetical protein
VHVDRERVLRRAHDQQRQRHRALQGAVRQPVEEHLKQARVGALERRAGDQQQIGSAHLLGRVLDRRRRLWQQQPPGQNGQVDDGVAGIQSKDIGNGVGRRTGNIKSARARFWMTY